MEEYLAFIDEIGRTIDGNYLYRFDFTKEPETVWGEYFHVIPSIIIPNLQPDKNTLSKTGRVILPTQLQLAKKSGCFSMQDCFDDILPLGFSDIDDEYNIIFRFGEKYNDVIDCLKALGTEMTDIEEISNKAEDVINNFIENIEPKSDFGTILDEAIEEANFKEIMTLRIGEEISFETIKKSLFDGGYENIDFVHKKGQYTIRGGFIDIFSFNTKYNNPFRLSFFGNEIVDIFSFDIMEQTPIEHFNEITIYKKNID